MKPAIFLGDEVSAAGYRLAGLQVHSPPAGAEQAALALARTAAPLVLLSAVVAAGVPEVVLRSALSATTPLVLIVPDLHGRVPLPDLAARLRAQLGLEA